ncbi:nuclease-related domain-containing protein [Rossellomorea aquimaris]|uniref:nuclease-related domain-containing protein n=1 Tax=Rossellomorea aquimaris TaxID=189382 RepID=UPI0007D0AD06|nr:nuclease-related domain-containing protein [Rossellomorea aquimaris]
MILKERKVPLRILQSEALLRRLSPEHPLIPIIQEDLRKRRAGFRGEQDVDRHLELLADEDFTIFHDVRLLFGNHYFQMDTLILTSYFAVILEVKNIFGTLEFDLGLKQLIRKANGKGEGFLDPITQVKKQEYIFRKWLLENKINQLPIKSFVVISNPTTILKVQNNEELRKYVTHLHNLYQILLEYKQHHQSLKLEVKDLRRLSKKIIKSNTPVTSNSLEYYNLKKEDIQTGVICPECGTSPMMRKCGVWICSYCRATSKSAHVQALSDFFILLKPTITNQEAKTFLHLSSRDQTYTILKKSNFSSTDSTKNREYFLPTILQ